MDYEKNKIKFKNLKISPEINKTASKPPNFLYKPVVTNSPKMLFSPKKTKFPKTKEVLETKLFELLKHLAYEKTSIFLP